MARLRHCFSNAVHCLCSGNQGLVRRLRRAAQPQSACEGLPLLQRTPGREGKRNAEDRPARLILASDDDSLEDFVGTADCGRILATLHVSDDQSSALLTLPATQAGLELLPAGSRCRIHGALACATYSGPSSSDA